MEEGSQKGRGGGERGAGLPYRPTRSVQETLCLALWEFQVKLCLKKKQKSI